MILKDRGGEGDGHIDPKEDPQGHNKPGASGWVAVLFHARYDGRYCQKKGLGDIASVRFWKTI